MLVIIGTLCSKDSRKCAFRFRSTLTSWCLVALETICFSAFRCIWCCLTTRPWKILFALTAFWAIVAQKSSKLRIIPIRLLAITSFMRAHRIFRSRNLIISGWRLKAATNIRYLAFYYSYFRSLLSQELLRFKREEFGSPVAKMAIIQ